MTQVIISEKKPIKIWTDYVEDGAIHQAKNLANLPFTYKWVAIMPDVHQGYGMPIGGVLATTGVVIPNAVGVDIGCGMCAVKTSLQYIEPDNLKSIINKIRSRIPVGFGHHKTPKYWDGFDNAPDIPIIQQELSNSTYQLGTLGGGNHFIEIQKGSDENIWIMLHSGSRNFGLKIATEYHKKALKLCESWYSSLPDKDLAFLPMETNEAKEYMAAMNFALDFAQANRNAMADAIKLSICDVIAGTLFDTPINIHHNYAAIESHFNENVIVHRKGATSARRTQIGIIPGSQGTKSYIVRGKGNPDSFMSCSHGAGRKMGRKQAQRELNLETEKKHMDDLGILHSLSTVENLDEAAGAYKDIDTVMKDQDDLVEILVELRPIAVIKS